MCFHETYSKVHVLYLNMFDFGLTWCLTFPIYVQLGLMLNLALLSIVVHNMFEPNWPLSSV
jgi:hypothetical protein